MTKQEIEENNTLIALFMGYELKENTFIWSSKPVKYLQATSKYNHCPEGLRVEIKNFKYHYAWDWLMPVVLRIGTLREVHYWEITEMWATFRTKECRIEQFTKETSNSIIECVYQTVIEFIKWYNENETKS